MDFQQISENNKLLLVSRVNGLQERKKDNKILHISGISHLSASYQIPNSSRPIPFPNCALYCRRWSNIRFTRFTVCLGVIENCTLGIGFYRTTFLACLKIVLGGLGNPSLHYWGQDKEKVEIHFLMICNGLKPHDV